MKNRELYQLGVPRGECVKIAGLAVKEALETGRKKAEVCADIRCLVEAPTAWTEDRIFGELAREIAERQAKQATFIPREENAPWKQWGDDLEEMSVKQMQAACELPVSVRGALMPDAHVGYGLPIGGVLATRGAVIPYAVGVDIACRMKMTVLDLPVGTLEKGADRLKTALTRETSFGIGAKFKKKRQHDVLDRDWSVSKVTEASKDRAWSQLGTSGSGNHFVEFGTLRLDEEVQGLAPGTYLALLSHSGSRGTGAAVADHYSKLAKALHPELPDRLANLAWLDLESEEGQEYWEAMNLMGHYAAANHACIHRAIAAHLGVQVLLDLENHHNFAWKEEHDGEELIVHRKGATPAGEGVVGIIPGSMASPGYVVRGRGDARSLDSASHGAGRRMSRKKAKELFNWNDSKAYLRERGVTLLSAGLDEMPQAYKDIDEVMASQSDLVQTIARFDPKLVRMAPAGERPED